MSDALAAQQITDGAIHQYRMDETSGTAIIDYGSSPVNGTYTNMVLNQTPIVPGAVCCPYWNGTSAYADFNWDVTAVVSQAFTLEIVYYCLQAVGVYAGVFMNEDPWNGSSPGVSLWGVPVSGNTALPFCAGFVGGTCNGINSLQNAPSVTRTLCDLVWRGTGSPTMELWQNGVKLCSAATSGNYRPSSYHMQVGHDPRGGTYWFQGYFSDFALYHFDLSAAQMANHTSLLAPSNVGNPVIVVPSSGIQTEAAPPSALFTRPSVPSTGTFTNSTYNPNTLNVGQIFPTGRT